MQMSIGRGLLKILGHLEVPRLGLFRLPRINSAQASIPLKDQFRPWIFVGSVALGVRPFWMDCSGIFGYFGWIFFWEFWSFLRTAQGFSAILDGCLVIQDGFFGVLVILDGWFRDFGLFGIDFWDFGRYGWILWDFRSILWIVQGFMAILDRYFGISVNFKDESFGIFGHFGWIIRDLWGFSALICWLPLDAGDPCWILWDF